MKKKKIKKMNRQEIIDGLLTIGEFIQESDTEDENFYLKVLDAAIEMLRGGE